MVNVVVDNSPRDHKSKKNTKKKGLVFVHTGDGKGKSTAAFGMALRMMGHGKRVAIVQFIKGDWKTGESNFFKNCKDQCELSSMGDGFTWDTQNLEQDIKTAQKTWKKCRDVLRDKSLDLVIFDEINCVLKYNFLSVEEVASELQKKPEKKHVVLTGRNAPQEIMDLADLVSEMKCVKHPYESGIKAQIGIDF